MKGHIDNENGLCLTQFIQHSASGYIDETDSIYLILKDPSNNIQFFQKITSFLIGNHNEGGLIYNNYSIRNEENIRQKIHVFYIAQKICVLKSEIYTDIFNFDSEIERSRFS